MGGDSQTLKVFVKKIVHRQINVVKEKLAKLSVGIKWEGSLGWAEGGAAELRNVNSFTRSKIFKPNFTPKNAQIATNLVL